MPGPEPGNPRHVGGRAVREQPVGGRGATWAVVVLMFVPWLACVLAAAYFVLRENHEPRDLAVVAWIAATAVGAGVLLWRLRRSCSRRPIAVVISGAFVVAQAGAIAIAGDSRFALVMALVLAPIAALHVRIVGRRAGDYQRPVREVADADARTTRRWTTPF